MEANLTTYTVTFSTTDTKCMSLIQVVKEGIWLGRLLGDLNLHHDHQVVMACDSLSAICLAKNQVCHKRTKHIKSFKMIKIGIVDNLNGIFTKHVPHGKFQNCIDLLNVLYC